MYVCRAFLNACFGRFKVGLKDLSLVFIKVVQNIQVRFLVIFGGKIQIGWDDMQIQSLLKVSDPHPVYDAADQRLD